MKLKKSPLLRFGVLFFILAFILYRGVGLACKSWPSCERPSSKTEPRGHLLSGDPIPFLSAPSSPPPLKINIRGVVKNAVAVAASDPLRVSLPEGARELRFAAGVVPGTAPGPVNLTVREKGGPLHSFEVDPDSPQGWREVKVRVEGGGEVVIGCDWAGDGVYIAHPRPWFDDQSPQWVVFILIDALRADAMGVYGERKGTTPELDELALAGAVFDRAYTSSPFTLTSLASIFTGLHPWQHQVIFSAEGGLWLSESLPNLVETFQRRGFHTAAFSGTYFFLSRNGFARGFDSMDETCAPAFFNESADCLNRRVLPWLSERSDEPVFLYLHYVDPHAPYFAPEPFRHRYTAGLPRPKQADTARGEVKQFTGDRGVRSIFRSPSADDLKYLRGLYRGEVAYVDSRAGELVKGIEEALPEGAPPVVIVVSADHGEAFYEHGVMEHVASLHDPVMRVPLIFHAPGRIPAGSRFDDPARTIDIMPTLLELAGIEPPSGLAGRSLVPLFQGERLKPTEAAAFHHVDFKPEYALLAWPWKLLYRPESGEMTLYRLDQDPGEQTDLAGSKPAKAHELRSMLEELLTLSAPEADGSRPVPDPETRERLRALGYVGD